MRCRHAVRFDRQMLISYSATPFLMLNKCNKKKKKKKKDEYLVCSLSGAYLHERERENYAEKGGNPFLHMLREWTLT